MGNEAQIASFAAYCRPPVEAYMNLAKRYYLYCLLAKNLSVLRLYSANALLARTRFTAFVVRVVAAK
jgi:hypothetical protein